VTQAGGRNYTYLFTPESSVPLTRCGHTVELPSVFCHPEMTAGTGRAFDETFSRTLRRMWVQFATCGDPCLAAEDSPDGCAKAWPAYDLETRQVMVFDEDDIHVEPEAMRQIVDWERTYFLTRYYGI
jgi:para-nitrobenzyl esterase